MRRLAPDKPRESHSGDVSTARYGRRTGAFVGALTLAASSIAVTACSSSVAATPTTTTQSKQATAIVNIARDAMRTQHLNAVIVRVTVNGKPIVTQALGDSVPGVSATTAMQFPNGAVAFSYLSTLLLEFVDEHKVRLSDTIDRWMPDIPDANRITLKMLANNTSGIPDFETSPTFLAEQYANPFRLWNVKERLAIAFETPILYEPGTNWSYAHTNFVILGVILQKIGGKPLATLLHDKVLKPLGLQHTVASEAANIPSPALHGFSSERRVALGIPPKTPFYEDTTSWNSSWGTPPGATETTNIYDLTKTAEGIGSGTLLSKSSYQAQTSSQLIGFGKKTPQCRTCHQNINYYNYGLGVIRTGSWLAQNPLLDGYAAVEAYLPSKKIAIAVAVTFSPGAFNSEGSYPNSGDYIFRAIGRYMAPKDAPPRPPTS